jgi:hypothetical protein
VKSAPSLLVIGSSNTDLAIKMDRLLAAGNVTHNYC